MTSKIPSSSVNTLKSVVPPPASKMSTSSSGNSTIPLNSSRGRSRTGETPQVGVNYIPEGREHIREAGRTNLFGAAGGTSTSGWG